jgi:transmembrane sensor
MTHASPLKEATTPLQAAAIWRMRMEAADWSERDEAAFRAWLAQDELHQRAFERTGKVWDLVDTHAATPDVMVIRRNALHRAQRTARGRLAVWRAPPRRMAIAAALAGVVVLAGLGSSTLLGGGDVYRTGLNERRVVTLKDGSKVSLDAMTRIVVDYSDDARRLTLARGQARFDVAHDASRPFSVRARDRTVVATGTAFNIDIFERKARVTLIEGRVLVLAAPQRLGPIPLPGPAKPARAIELKPGQELVSGGDVPPELVAHVDLQQTTAWQQGKLMFDKEPLAEAVARMNRYSERKIVIGDAAAGAVPISGAFDAGNVKGFLEAVTAYLPVNATESGDGVTLTYADGRA